MPRGQAGQSDAEALFGDGHGVAGELRPVQVLDLWPHRRENRLVRRPLRPSERPPGTGVPTVQGANPRRCRTSCVHLLHPGPRELGTGRPDHRRVLAKGALADAAALLFGAAPAPAAARDAAPLLRPRLPALGGPYPVCAATQYLADPSRNDPWDREIGVRELMVTVLRPAAPGHRFPRAAQMPPGAAASFADLAHWTHQPLPRTGVGWTATLTPAWTGARPRPVRGRPVLLYGPGGGDARTMGNSLAMDLASHGWMPATCRSVPLEKLLLEKLLDQAVTAPTRCLRRRAG